MPNLYNPNGPRHPCWPEEWKKRLYEPELMMFDGGTSKYWISGGWAVYQLNADKYTQETGRRYVDKERCFAQDAHNGHDWRDSGQLTVEGQPWLEQRCVNLGCKMMRAFVEPEL